MVGLLALVTASIFFGAAIYINIAEQPVRLGLDDGSALAQCRPADILTIEFAALMSSGSALRGGWETKMGVFRRKVPAHYIPVHPDNIGKNDWIILLEAGTIVCPSAEKLRVARATLERKIVTKYNMLLRAKHFLVLEGYDPRIHALYFCPQLYALDSDNRLVPLEGEEIGELLARALKKGAVKRQPWYEPLDKLPREPIIATTMDTDFETLLVDRPVVRDSSVVRD
jgi:hypothetical protein